MEANAFYKVYIEYAFQAFQYNSVDCALQTGHDTNTIVLIPIDAGTHFSG